MARQPDIQYIRFYTDGSAARKIAPVTPLKTIKLPKIKLKKRVTIHLDPLAMAGIVMAVVMMVLMAVGTAKLSAVTGEMETMSNYVQSLSTENAQLQQTFTEGYDLEEVERTALALGLVPKEQVRHITVPVPPVQVEEEPDAWQRLYTFLTGLFA